VQGNFHARFGERDGKDRSSKWPYGVPVPTLCSPEPSPEDVALNEKILQVSQLLEIPMLDHIVVGQDAWVSMKDKGLGFR